MRDCCNILDLLRNRNKYTPRRLRQFLASKDYSLTTKTLRQEINTLEPEGLYLLLPRPMVLLIQ